MSDHSFAFDWCVVIGRVIIGFLVDSDWFEVLDFSLIC